MRHGRVIAGLGLVTAAVLALTAAMVGGRVFVIAAAVSIAPLPLDDRI